LASDGEGEDEVMSIPSKMCPLITAALMIVASTAHAGPNEGIVLTPHGNVKCAETSGDICGVLEAQLPDTCEETDPNACPDSYGLEMYIAVAAGETELAFNTITFGIGEYDLYACYLPTYGPCRPDLGALEIPSAGWPDPYTGTSISWAPNCLHGTLVPVYYFGFYVYYSGGPVPFGDFYPGRPATVTSCGDPPEEDPIVGFGVIGCGDDPGQQVCPGGPVPARPTTWGQIKRIYR
jgi:hypothetical protein